MRFFEELKAIAPESAAAANRIFRFVDAHREHPQRQRLENVGHLMRTLAQVLREDDGETELVAVDPVEIETEPVDAQIKRRHFLNSEIIMKMCQEQSADDPEAVVRYVFAAAVYCHRCGLDYLHLVNFDDTEE